jgi:hypothetical protein
VITNLATTDGPIQRHGTSAVAEKQQRRKQISNGIERKDDVAASN